MSVSWAWLERMGAGPQVTQRGHSLSWSHSWPGGGAALGAQPGSRAWKEESEASRNRQDSRLPGRLLGKDRVLSPAPLPTPLPQAPALPLPELESELRSEASQGIGCCDVMKGQREPSTRPGHIPTACHMQELQNL